MSNSSESEEGKAGNHSSDVDLGERNIGTYEHAITDARRTHDNQLEAYNDIGEKAWRIVRLNGIVATIIIAALTNSQSLRTSISTIEPFYVIGGIGIILSTLFAIFGQRAKWVKLGPESEFYQEVRDLNPSKQEYLLKTLEGYEIWLEELKTKTAKNGHSVSIAMYLFLISITFIMAGSLIAIV